MTDNATAVANEGANEVNDSTDLPSEECKETSPMEVEEKPSQASSATTPDKTSDDKEASSPYAVSRYEATDLSDDERDESPTSHTHKHSSRLVVRGRLRKYDDDDDDDEDEEKGKDKDKDNSEEASKMDNVQTNSEDRTVANSNSTAMTSPSDTKVDPNPPTSSKSTPVTSQDKLESIWEEVTNDALELENLIFSIRRPSARNRLTKLVMGLKQLGAKLKRHEEVTFGLEVLKRKDEAKKETERDNTNNLAEDDNGGATKRKIEGETVEKSNKKVKTETTEVKESSAVTMTNTPVETETPLFTTDTNKTVDSATDTPAVSEPSPILAQAPAPLETSENSNNTTKKTTTEASASDATSNTASNIEFLTAAPLLKQKDKWVHNQMRNSHAHCPDYNANNTCPLGSSCTRLHVYKPNHPSAPADPRLKFKPPTNTPIQTYTREDLERAYQTYRSIPLQSADYAEKIKPDLLHQPRYTSNMICPIDRTIYYAHPHPDLPLPSPDITNKSITPTLSSQDIWWFKSMKEARDAVATVVIRHLQSQNIVPNTFKPDTSSSNISPQDALARKKNASAMAASKAASLARTGTTKKKASATATATVKPAPVSANHSNSVLPQIHPWNWMEVSYKSRCTLFHRKDIGCDYGRNCTNAHVHYPSMVKMNLVPKRGALKVAYWRNFKIMLNDLFFTNSQTTTTKQQTSQASYFCTNSAVDNLNKTWYTAAWACPHEATIYYAAGGMNGRVNAQNMFLYPTIDDAKLAVCGVVLNAFLGRNLFGSWEEDDDIVATTSNECIIIPKEDAPGNKTEDPRLKMKDETARNTNDKEVVETAAAVAVMRATATAASGRSQHQEPSATALLPSPGGLSPTQPTSLKTSEESEPTEESDLEEELFGGDDDDDDDEVQFENNNDNANSNTHQPQQIIENIKGEEVEDILQPSPTCDSTESNGSNRTGALNVVNESS